MLPIVKAITIEHDPQWGKRKPFTSNWVWSSISLGLAVAKLVWWLWLSSQSLPVVSPGDKWIVGILSAVGMLSG